MEDLKQRVEELRQYFEKGIGYLYPTRAWELIKDLDFELSESELNVEIWKNTDEMSQARIKELEEREDKLVEVLEKVGGHLHDAWDITTKEQIEKSPILKELQNILGIANKGEV